MTSSARGEALGARELRRHDRAHLAAGEAAARHDARDLLVLGAVDDEHARRRAPRGRRARAAAARRGCRRGRASARPRVAAAARISGCRMRLEPRARRRRRRIRARAAWRGRACRRRGSSSRPERRDDRAWPGCARRGQRVREAVGVGDLDAERGERVGHRRLAAADAAGQADDERMTSSGQVERDRAPGRRTARSRRRSRGTARTPAACCGRGP